MIVYYLYMVGWPIRLQLCIPDIYHCGSMPFPGLCIVAKRVALHTAIHNYNQRQRCTIDIFLIGKHSIIIPIHKSGNIEEPTNFRPINLLPILSKILEKVISTQLTEYLENNNL